MTLKQTRRSSPVPPSGLRSRLPWFLAAGALLVLPGAWILLSGGDDTPLVLHRAEAEAAAARRRESEGRWEEAAAEYERAIETVKGRKGLEAQGRAWKGALAELRDRIRRKEALDRRWKATGAGASLRELQELLEASKGWPVPWRAELETRVAAWKPSGDPLPPAFEVRRRDLNARHGNHWAELRKAWEEYAAGARTAAEDARKAREELGRLESRAKEDLRSVRLRAERLEPAAGRALLEAEAPRFRGLACEAELRAALGR